MKDNNALINLLIGDKLTYSSHLKMVEEYGGSIEYKLLEGENGLNAAMLIPVACSSFDSALYPDAAYIVYLVGAGGQITPAILAVIPKDRDLIFKIHNPEYRKLIEKRFPLEWRRSLLSYTCKAGRAFGEYPEVIRDNCMDERLLPLWLKNGYGRKDIEKYFGGGAVSFSIYKSGRPASTCIIFRNSIDIWEIGAVHTAEGERGKGYARMVVSAALKAILAAGNIPKYQVADSNLPSVKLAESVGLELFLKLEHWYYHAESASRNCH